VVYQAEIHRMARSEDVEERKRAVEELKNNFALLEDKKYAWEDLIKLTSDTDSEVLWHAASALRSVFSQVPDKKQAWYDLHRLTSDTDSDVRWVTACVLRNVFSQVPDKKQAWNDLINLAQDGEINVGWGATDPLGSVFAYVHDKKQAQDDLHQIIQDEGNFGRFEVALALGGAFAYVPDKDQAWNDLQRLTHDEDSDVQTYANYSLGKVSIFKAANSENDDDLKKEMEAAIGYFEKSSKQSFWSEPAKFCLPFYRSFYTLTFTKEETGAEVQKYITEAKSAIEGSESKEKLLEAVENLGNALMEAQRARDSNEIKSDLNIIMRYCDRACELLDTTEEKAPGASRLIRKGLPIIDERIKGILAEIEENTTALCKQTKGTQLDNFGREIYWQGHNLPQIGDPIKLDKKINGMQSTLTMLCGRLIEENIIEELEILNKINDERYVENKVEMMDSVMRRILIKVKGMKKIDVKINGNDNKINIDSVDNSININGNLTTDLETLYALIERDYKQADRNEVLQTVNQMKRSCNDSSKKSWIKQKLGWIISRTSEVASISSFAITLLQNVK
jgi:HEAT repeat protein